MNAADYYGLDELRRACMGFVTCCITVDTVNSILASAERYIQYKCTKSLVQRVSTNRYCSLNKKHLSLSLYTVYSI
jgi:ribosomal protein L33